MCTCQGQPQENRQLVNLVLNRVSLYRMWAILAIVYIQGHIKDKVEYLEDQHVDKPPYSTLSLDVVSPGLEASQDATGLVAREVDEALLTGVESADWPLAHIFESHVIVGIEGVIQDSKTKRR